jgi:RecB family exonuclease
MIERYRQHPLAAARTLAVEVGFNMRVGQTRVRGLVDRVCELDGRVALIDFKTNATLDDELLEAYSLQLCIYALAAHRGLLAGGQDVACVLFDMRRGRMHEIEPDDGLVERRILEASSRIAAGDYALGPQHAQRPCKLCAFRSICSDARKVL